MRYRNNGQGEDNTLQNQFGLSDSCTEIMDAAVFSTELRIKPAKSRA